MYLVSNVYDIPLRESGRFVAIGKWDGVHVAHQAVLSALVAEAKAEGALSVAMGFHPLPMAVLRPHEAPPVLQTLQERAEVMASMGLDVHMAIPFGQHFANMAPQAFVRDVLAGELQCRKVMVGFNFTFGRGGAGTAEMLRQLCEAEGIPVQIFGPIRIDGESVSSTEVRLYVASGEMERAARLLGRPFSLTAMVVGGDQRGRQIGYPTANLQVTQRRQLPATGVYVARATILETEQHPGVLPYVLKERMGPTYGAMLNLGWRPTFQGQDLRCEVHLFDFAGDLYGRELRVEFLHHLRGEQSFAEVEALKRQLATDEAAAREYLRKI